MGDRLLPEQAHSASRGPAPGGKLRQSPWDRPARLVIGDEQYLFLDALATVVSQHGHTVCAVARSAPEILAVVRDQQPDMCLINRHVASAGDAEIITAMVSVSNSTSVLVLSSDPSAEAVGRALGAGASGYVHKARGIEALAGAIGRMLQGEVVVDVPEVTKARREPEQSQAHRLAARLTDRERECLLMLVEGLDTTAMAARLGIARNTVRTHLQSVLTKLGVHSRLEAASLAVRYRLDDTWSGARVREMRALRPSR